MILFDLDQLVLEYESMDTKLNIEKNSHLPVPRNQEMVLHLKYQNKNHVILNPIQWTRS